MQETVQGARSIMLEAKVEERSCGPRRWSGRQEKVQSAGSVMLEERVEGAPQKVQSAGSVMLEEVEGAPLMRSRKDDSKKATDQLQQLHQLEVDQLRQELNSLQAEHTTLQERNKELRSQTVQVTEADARPLAVRLKLQESLRQSEAKVAALEQQSASLELEVASVSSVAKDLNACRAELRIQTSSNTELSGEIDALKTLQADSTHRNAQLAKELNLCQAKL